MRRYGYCLLFAALIVVPASGMAQSSNTQSDQPQSEVSLGEFARNFRKGPHTKKVYTNANLPREGDPKPVDRLKKLGIKSSATPTKPSEPAASSEANNAGAAILQKVLALPSAVSATVEQFGNNALGDPEARSKALIEQYKAMQELLPPPSMPAQ